MPGPLQPSNPDSVYYGSITYIPRHTDTEHCINVVLSPKLVQMTAEGDLLILQNFFGFELEKNDAGYLYARLLLEAEHFSPLELECLAEYFVGVWRKYFGFYPAFYKG